MLALSLLAAAQHKEARRVALEGIVNAPDEPFAFFAAAYVHFQQDEYKKARHYIDEAIRLDNSNAWFLDVSARIYLVQGKLKEALAESERGLDADPEHVSCLNARAMTLIRLKRASEALTSVEKALSHDPDSSLTHANKGWLLLESKGSEEAMTHFKEALRLQPGNSRAREGVIEALKHRHPLYGVIASSSLQLSKVARTGPLFWMIWLIPPLRALYLLLVLLSWFGNQFFNLALSLDKVTRRVLTPVEVASSHAFGVLMLVFSLLIPLLGFFHVLSEPASMVARRAVILFAFPLSRTFYFEGRSRVLMVAYDLVVAICGLCAVVLSLHSKDIEHLPDDAESCLGVVIVMCIGALFFRPKRPG